MIHNRVRGDIFAASQKHIAFAVNTDGYNDAGFAGQVSSRMWPKLANTGGNKLGDVLTHKHDGKTYYALVCHSLDRGGGTRRRVSPANASTRSRSPMARKSLSS